ncbi:hypothetical protein N7466_000858 [Penicillium verhagenii]|uniref:uncharacterized protein n=1 Tax=Penicillium verhagenii TaxID=1562060 RepID=UPI00254545F7|nr:uncharacterized protein N7466_000858 [Penicillium verhagenii]KAJ5947843.1 hypothetical protein N7466_000858 [Penicillium verhagenii]
MFLFSKNKNMKYDKLAGDVELEEDSPVDNPQSPMQFQRFGLILALTTANILSAVFIFAIFARQGKQAHDMFQTGYPTDFDSARQHIELEQVIFTGSPSYTYAGVEFQHHPAKVQYVGKPSSEIDQAWTDLVSGGEFLITEEEVNTQWPGVNSELWDQEHGGYMVRLEVFQTLGCLDLVRRGLSPAYYNLTDDDHAYSSNGELES